ncbi:hypothetical protein PALA12_02171 [Pseudomonas aeruginosa]|nr:hypothetical protein PALA12_02171 [Pseudomonas aeruginosa]
MTSAASSSDRLRPLRRQPGDSRRTRGPSRHSLTARAANGSSGRVDGAGSALPCSSRTIAENQTPSSRRRSATSSRSSGADRLRARRRAPLAEDEERRAPGVALQAGQAHEEGGRRQQAQRRRLMAGTGVVAQGPGAAEQQQAEQGGQRRRATGGADAYPVGDAGDEAPQLRGFVAPCPGGAGRLRARRDHRLSPWPASSRRLSHCVSSALTMRLACRSRSSSSARERSAIRW